MSHSLPSGHPGISQDKDCFDEDCRLIEEKKRSESPKRPRVFFGFWDWLIRGFQK